MRKKIFKKVVSVLVLMVIVTVPYFNYPKKTHAQSITSEIAGAVVPIITQLPLCNKKISSTIANLFGGKKLKQQQEDDKKKEEEDAKAKAEAEAEAVFTYDKYGTKTLSKINQRTQNIEKSAKSLDQNDTCLKSIGRVIVKQMIQSLTVSTVNWINSGFNGGPAFVQEPGVFFGNIAKNEILQFGIEINNPELFPFGTAFMQNQVNAFNTKFAQNAQYSLNEMIQSTTPEFNAATFQADFSMGGWSAWDAMTQVPANNPLGFNLMASNELQKRLEGTSQSNAQDMRDALQQAGGYLGDYRCADPEGLSKSDHDEALAMGDKEGTCKEWAYVTPGKMVADAATSTMAFENDSLFNVEDLNGAIAAILDALLNSFTSNIQNTGFADFPTTGSDGSFFQTEGSFLDYTTTTEKDYPEYMISNSTFLQNNPDFDIRKDLTQAIVDEQRIFMDKLTEQNTIIPDLIKAIHQLDYCLPGPHPGWKSDSSKALNDTLSDIPGYTEDINASTVSELIDILDPSGIVNWVVDLFGSGDDKKEQQYYSTIVTFLTGLKPELNGKLATLQQVDNLLNTIFERYANIIDEIFERNPNMPLVKGEAESVFKKIPGYEVLKENNTETIDNMKGVLSRLINIKTKIDELNEKIDPNNSNPISQEEYESELSQQKISFGRISEYLVSGDDIAVVDELFKKLQSEKDYVYKDLLKGPGGCEQDLSTGLAIHMPWQVFNTKRMSYPYPILYDYNLLGDGDLIPDPWNSNYQNKMIQGTPVNNVGPGFLSYTHFSNDWSGTSVITADDFKPEQFINSVKHPGVLTLSADPDANPANPDDWATSLLINIGESGTNGILGRGSSNCSSLICQGLFESVIKIY